MPKPHHGSLPLMNMKNTQIAVLRTVIGTSWVAAALSAPAEFVESGGRVVIEAEHFTVRAANLADNHHWHVVPDDNFSDFLKDSPEQTLIPQFGDARGSYIVALPNLGQNKNQLEVVLTEPYAEYAFRISAAGEYRLWTRWAGYDDAADSMYAGLVELQDDLGGIPDWYRFSHFDRSARTNFMWQGDGAAEHSGGAGGEIPMTWQLEPGSYHLRLYQREDGAAVDALMLQLLAEPDPTGQGPAESTFDGLMLVQQPQSVTVRSNGIAMLQIGVLGSGAAIQWQSAPAGSTNFTDVGSATNLSYSTDPLPPSQTGLQFRAVVSAAGTNLTSRAATVTVDATPPMIVGAFAAPDSGRINIVFDEPLDPLVAASITNYAAEGLTLSSPLLIGGNTVVLRTTPLTTNTTYSLSLQSIADLIGNIAAPTNVSFQAPSLNRGGLMVEVWNGVPGSGIADLTGSTNFSGLADLVTSWGNFGPYDPADISPYGDNFGARVTGWIVPPTNGTYKFFLRSDDASELYLSTDADPANEAAEPIARISGFTTEWQDSEGGPSSTPIDLQGGQRYWVRALWKEGASADYMQVAWRTPYDTNLNDATGLRPIPGIYLESLADPSSAAVTILQQPLNASVVQGSNTTLNVEFRSFSAFGTNTTVQWQMAPAGSTNFTDIPGALSPSLNLTGDLAQTGTRYRAVISNLISITTEAATVTVTAPGAARLSIALQPDGQVRISWTGSGTLEEAAAPSGVWVDSTAQANPQTRAPTDTSRYFRVRQ